MPNRIIRENILTSERVASLKWPEEVFYRRLMSVADDYGRFDGRPEILRSRLYPLQLDIASSPDVSSWIAACERAGLVRSYSLDGKPYIEILRFGQPTRTPSKYPNPDNPCAQMISFARLSVSGSVSESECECVSDSVSDPPLTPLAGGNGKSPPSETAPHDADAVPLPSALDTPAFAAAWREWLDDRQERRKKVTVRAAMKQLSNLLEMGHDRAIAAIKHSIGNGYTGLYEPDRKGGGAAGSSGRHSPPADQRRSDKAGREYAENLSDLPIRGAGGVKP